MVDFEVYPLTITLLVAQSLPPTWLLLYKRFHKEDPPIALIAAEDGIP